MFRKLFTKEELIDLLFIMSNVTIPPAGIEQVELFISELCARFAFLVAEDISLIYSLEWRDVERLVAEILDKIGFDVILTPPAKDGGKDIIAGCQINGTNYSYIIEVKHWNKMKVGGSHLIDFLQVVAFENRNRGLFLATSGFASNAFEVLAEIDRNKIKMGDKMKLASLCKLYTKLSSGLYLPKTILPHILFEGTF